MKCVHCKRNKMNRPRGLCFGCFEVAAIREQYPMRNSYGNGHGANLTGPRPLPSAPTTALPGTEDKIRELEARAKAKTQLFHPDDRQEPRSPADVYRFLSALAAT